MWISGRYTVPMSDRKSPISYLRCFILLLFTRALPLLLLALILLTLAFTLSELRRWLEERAYFEGQREQVAQIATEIAESKAAPSASNHLLAARVSLAQPLQTTPEVAVETPPPLPTVRYVGDPAPGQQDITAVPPRLQPLDRQGNDLVNILLLGSDSELGFANQRTDTIIVLSVNRTTGTAAMLSLPRDLLAWVPIWGMHRLNQVYSHGERGGWRLGGFDLLRQTILYNYGINVHYHVLIDFSGLRQVVDFVDGVEIVVECAIKDKEHDETRIPDEARKVEGVYSVLDAGVYEFDGLEALWYARSRRGATDLERGRRQQQILRGVWSRLRNNGQLQDPGQLYGLWQLAQSIVTTDLPLDVLTSLLPVGLGLGPDDIAYHSLQLKTHTIPWTTPAGAEVLLPVYESLLPVLREFYLPPTDKRLRLVGPSIRVLNGSSQPAWDRIAASHLVREGLNATAAGPTLIRSAAQTTLNDFSGATKGSLSERIAALLDIHEDQIFVNADPAREVDYEVIIGEDYKTCRQPNILKVN